MTEVGDILGLLEDMDPPEALASVLRGIAEIMDPVVMSVMDANPGAPRSADMPAWRWQAANLMDALDEMMTVCKAYRDHLGEPLARSMPRDESLLLLDGLPPMVSDWHRKRTRWANDELRDIVRTKVRYDRDGEEITDPEQLVDAVEAVVSFIGGNVKMGGLRGLGINPDDYCVSEPLPPTMKIERG